MQIKIPFNLSSLIATWFFIGRIPIASGTLGSLAFYPLYYFLLTQANNYEAIIGLFWTLFIFLFFIGLWAVSEFQDQTRAYDHSSIVIDEVVGMSATFAISYKWIMVLSLAIYEYIEISSVTLTFILGFIMFRIYDIKKPFFIRYIDRNYKNALGVIGDDIAAALCASFTFYIINLIYDSIRYL
jgi:phosphatidylglycerophosphatase A